jgi:hypothetical protein
MISAYCYLPNVIIAITLPLQQCYQHHFISHTLIAFRQILCDYLALSGDKMCIGSVFTLFPEANQNPKIKCFSLLHIRSIHIASKREFKTEDDDI